MLNKYEGKSSQNQSELDASIQKSKGIKFTIFKFFYIIVNSVNFSVLFVAIVNFIELGQTISYSLSIFVKSFRKIIKVITEFFIMLM